MSEEKIKSSQDIIQLSEQGLSEQELRELIEKAWREGGKEAQFILTMSEWHRPGPSFSDFSEIKVLYGEIEQILVDHVYNYPTTDEYTYFIIPKSRAVVLLCEYGDNYQGKMQRHAKLYIFSYPKGWKTISLY